MLSAFSSYIVDFSSATVFGWNCESASGKSAEYPQFFESICYTPQKFVHQFSTSIPFTLVLLDPFMPLTKRI